MSVTYPLGFVAAGVAAGLKKSGGLDLAVVVNRGTRPAAAAVFTPNRFAAAPVLWSREAITAAAPQGRCPVAVVLNSGGANACTGPAGYRHAQAEAEHLATRLGLPDATDVLVCSTGLIGELLPIDRVLAGIDDALAEIDGAGVASGGVADAAKVGPADAPTGGPASAADGGAAAAEAIMTTDTRPKTTAATAPAGYRIGGMAKGAGMLAPELATMLVTLTTDAVLTPAQAQTALEEACRTTFNRIDSDGCMSTNDTVILLASGESGITPDPAEFTATLTACCADLARQLIGDAEGASHDIRIDVTGATTEAAALAVARAIARSNLLKTAIFGNDPNWGRVLSAAGTVPPDVAPYDPTQVDVTINGVTVCVGGGVGADRDLVDLAGRDVGIVVGLSAGDASATLWTNDLTHDYVHENSAYSS